MKKEAPRDEYLRKRAERQRKIRKRRITAFFVFFIIMLLCVGVVLSLTVFFPIEKLTASGSKIYSAEEILKSSNINNGDNLFAVSQSKTEKTLKAKLPFVESVTFEREIPNTLKIKVKDAVEFACYKVKDIYYTVSSSGWVLEKSLEAPENLLNVNALGVNCKVGSEVAFEDESQKEMIRQITTALKEENINGNVIDITNLVEITLRVENRFDVNLGTANNLNEKVRHLAGMIGEISKEKTGKINLSMWTSDNTRGTFTAQN